MRKSLRKEDILCNIFCERWEKVVTVSSFLSVEIFYLTKHKLITFLTFTHRLSFLKTATTSMSYNQTIDTNNKVKELLTTESIMLLLWCFSVPCILFTILIASICFKKPKCNLCHNAIHPSPEDIKGCVDEFQFHMPPKNSMDYCCPM